MSLEDTIQKGSLYSVDAAKELVESLNAKMRIAVKERDKLKEEFEIRLNEFNNSIYKIKVMIEEFNDLKDSL